MSLLKSKHLVAVRSGLPENIVSTTVNEDTGRRRFLGPETGFVHSKSRHNKTCANCGVAKTGRGTVCRPCSFALRKHAVVLKCANCSVEFERPRYEYEKALRKGHVDFYCSLPCSQAHHAVKNAKLCVVCGNPVGTTGGKHRNNTYCSHACRRAAAPPRSLPEIHCPQCGVFFQQDISRQQYCSGECADAAHSTRMIGAGNSHFKGVSSYAAWFRQMRPIILERDGCRCVACKVPEKVLIYTRCGKEAERTNMRIHHIDENVMDNRPENLVALCRTCHAVHHKSKTTPFPWLAEYARDASRSMTSKLREQATSLLTKFSSTTA